METYTYVYTGGRLTQETVTTVTTTDEGTETTTDTLDYTYGVNGPASVNWNGTEYYYLTNVQGDIVALLDESGNFAVQYSYDAWGDPLSTTGSMADTLGSRNSLRYRGYVFDDETGLYYLQSRYYNAECGRWINADSLVSTGQGVLGYNMFAYCKNNPTMYTDSLGMAPTWWQWAISGAMTIAGIALVATGVGGVAGGALICAGANSIVGSYVSEMSGGSSTAGWIGGMITGGACGTGAGVAGNLFIEATSLTGASCLSKLVTSGAVAFGSGAMGSTIGQCVSSAIDGKKINVQEVACSSIATGVINCLSGIGAGIGTAIKDIPSISTTSTSLANSLTAAWSLVSETACDFFGTIVSILQ